MRCAAALFLGRARTGCRGLAAVLVLVGGFAYAGESLLPNPKATFKDPGPPTFFWVGGAKPVNDAAAASAPATYRFKKEDGETICEVTLRRGDAVVQYGAYVKAEGFAKAKAGDMIVVRGMVRGDVAAPVKANLTVMLEGSSGGGDTVVVPVKSAAGKPELVGKFDWTPVEAVFPLPENTSALKVLCYASGGTGTVEWKAVDIALADAGAKATVTLKEKYLTAAERDREALTKYETHWKTQVELLKIPDAEKIYTPKPALSAAHPRIMLTNTPLATLQARVKDPRYAAYAADLFATARSHVANVPAKPSTMDAEDPLREYGDRPATVALAYLLAETPADKKLFLDGLVRYLEEMPTWGMPLRDLPLSQQMIAFSLAYDWTYADLPESTRAKARDHLIKMARFMRSPANTSAWQWRSQTQWLANHKWFNYAALAMASAALWGDEAAPLEKGEQKLWMDEAMQIFWVVAKTFGHDGAPVEGYNYQSYGNRPYFAFAALADEVTQCSISFVDRAGVRNMGVSRLHSLLPAGQGFFTYADSVPRIWDGSAQFRYLASRFKDSSSQLLADVMEDVDAREPDITDEYDASLPTYAEALAAWQKAASEPAPTEPMVLEAEEFKGGTVVDKIGAHGRVLQTGAAAKTSIEKTFDVPSAGFYHVFVKYAVAGSAVRQVTFDGKPPFRELSYVPFGNTGGWSSDRNQFRAHFLGEMIPRNTTQWQVYLTKGSHTIAFASPLGGGLNLDYVALVPVAMSKADALAKIGDKDVDLTMPKPKFSRAWQGLFWYDPAVPAAKVAELPLFRDNDDLGIYTARSSWTDPRAAFLGFKAGPVAGYDVDAIWGKTLSSGHSDPDEGTFSWYANGRAVIPGANYCHLKMTTNHSVIVVEGLGRDAGKLVGQIGEGGPWFGTNYKRVRDHARVLKVEHTPAYHTYLAELGGVYDVRDPRLKGQATLDVGYRRSITFFANGAVVVADRFTTDQPRTSHFRLLTAARNLKVDGRDFIFSFGRSKGRIVDLSPADYARAVSAEILPSFPNAEADPPPRDVAVIKAADTTSAVFIVAMGLDGAEKGITVEPAGDGLRIKDAPGGDVTIDWMSKIKVPPATAPAPAATPAR